MYINLYQKKIYSDMTYKRIKWSGRRNWPYSIQRFVFTSSHKFPEDRDSCYQLVSDLSPLSGCCSSTWAMLSAILRVCFNNWWSFTYDLLQLWKLSYRFIGYEYNLAVMPVTTLWRRKDKFSTAFLRGTKRVHCVLTAAIKIYLREGRI